MVQLKPEIYQLIVESLLATDETPGFETRLDQQQCLARMMQASKLLCKICEPYLYKDCLVGDMNLFVHDLEPKSRKEYLLNRVTTLRLYHPYDHSHDEPSYDDLFGVEKWKETGMKTGLQDHSGHLRRALRNKDYADKLWHRPAAYKLHAAVVDGDMAAARALRKSTPHLYVHDTPLEDQAFAKLERVIMTGVGDRSWGQPADYMYRLPFDSRSAQSLDHDEQRYPRYTVPRPIPYFLARLESLRHYCQTCTAGPLALENDLLRLANSPETVTYHVGTPSTTDPSFPPIVLGTVNRYIFDSPRVLISDGNGDEMDYHAVQEILQPIEEMLATRDEVLSIPLSSFPQYASIGSQTQFNTTRIELYDYTRHVDLDQVIAAGGPSNGMGPSNLKGTQEQLDLRIGKWKGKVFLKNREDMLPCPACGLGVKSA